MEKTTLSVPGISCGHCVNAIKNALLEMEGIQSVEGDSGNRQVTVEYDNPATMEKIRRALKEIDYPVE